MPEERQDELLLVVILLGRLLGRSRRVGVGIGLSLGVVLVLLDLGHAEYGATGNQRDGQDEFKNLFHFRIGLVVSKFGIIVT